METLFKHVDENLETYLVELQELLRFESISSDADKEDACRQTAQWLADHLKSIGLNNVQVLPTTGKPLVYAHHEGPAGAPTVLIYGHYDVQPVDPLELWDSPPFEPVIKDGIIWARGTTDDKGQLFTHVKALETLLKLRGELPVNIKILFEGEEEVGSPALTEWLPDNKDLLDCDVILVSDSSMIAKGQPSISYGLRGLAYFQLEMEAADGDLHSGSYGGAVANPLNELAKLLTSMKDDDHHITIEGFYDDVIDVTEEEQANYAKLPNGDERVLEETSAPALVGEAGFTTAERLGARPTLDANGIWGGFQGEGAKTVLPAKAGLKVSMRLVPNQDPHKIGELFRRHVEKHTPPSVKVKIIEMHGGFPFLCPLTEPALRKAAEAMEEVYGAECVFTREGGSIPIIADMARMMTKPVVLMGFGLNSEQAHAPNEHFDLDNFVKGIKTSLVYLNKLVG
ncbi:MAG: dipeptidase [Candidatus Lernaella stagnicola]|nr:dipeptidase [Candidatus Lernaella stagnicola]